MNPPTSDMPPRRWSVSPPRPRARSKRARQVARWFGLQRPHTRISNQLQPIELASLLPAPTQILLITGPSGSGKSSLLRELRTFASAAWIDLNQLDLPQKRALVDCFGKLPLESVLSLLSRVGLAEAWDYLRTPAELSEGQRWRLRVALGLHLAGDHPDPILVCDEFAALLDRVTAAVVSRALRRAVGASSNLRAIVATSHDDLASALAPDLHVRCDFGSIEVIRNITTGTAATTRSAQGSQRSQG